MRSSILTLLAALAFTTACGGDTPQQPAATQPQVSASAKPAAPAEPLKRVPRPAADVLHGAPPPTDDQLADLYDLSQDLVNLSQGDADAAGNFTDDLARFGPDGMPRTDLQALASDLGAGLKGHTLAADASYRLSHLLYAVMNAGTLTAAQRTALASDLQSTLTSAGSAAQPAGAAASRVERIVAASAAANRDR